MKTFSDFLKDRIKYYKDINNNFYYCYDTLNINILHLKLITVVNIKTKELSVIDNDVSYMEVDISEVINKIPEEFL